jgi:hypothetical protein
VRGQNPLFQEVENECIDRRTYRFHRVECERVSITLVGMEHAKRRVETDRKQREARFGFEQGVKIVEECIDGIGRSAGSAG